MSKPSNHDDNTRIVSVVGDMDALTVRQLRPQFTDIAATEGRDVTLDISGVDFIDSSGIGAIVFLYKRLVERKRKLEIHGVHGQPLELFRSLRIDRSITVHVAEAA
jgi:stage II sporulation protein AA (anti-sigma F factor antagonist)